MKITLVGGTHGNEKLGVEVVKHFLKNHKEGILPIIGNPLAVQKRIRFVDYDLNRSVNNIQSFGYEKIRVNELSTKIDDSSFLIDVHTTTSNMGVSIILSKSDSFSILMSRLIKKYFKDIKIIFSSKLDDESNFINSLTKSGFLIEVGPCKHNQYNQKQFLLVIKIIEFISGFNSSLINTKYLPKEYFRVRDYIKYPEMKKDNLKQFVKKDFKKIQSYQGEFFNLKNTKIELYDFYPIFVCEESYKPLNISFSICSKEYWS